MTTSSARAARAARRLAAAAGRSPPCACSAALAAACGVREQHRRPRRPRPPPATQPVASTRAGRRVAAPAPPATATPAGPGGRARPPALKVAVPTGRAAPPRAAAITRSSSPTSPAAPCTLYGYPGVSFVTAPGGSQIGPAATRNPAVPRQLVTLAPGQTAHAELQVVDAENYPPADCGLVTAHWLKIYPPNQTAPVYVELHRAGLLEAEADPERADHPAGRDRTVARPAFYRPSRTAARRGGRARRPRPAGSVPAMDDLTPRLRARLRPGRGRDARVQRAARVRRHDPGPVRRPGCGPGWPGWPRPRRAASGSTTRTTRRTWPRSSTPPGSGSATLELHRRNPILHLAALDLACYDRDYAPQQQRDEARAAHLAALAGRDRRRDRDPGPGQRAGRGRAGRRHPRAGRWHPARAPTSGSARPRWPRTPGWWSTSSRAAAEGDPDAALGPAALSAIMSSAEGMPVDLGRLSERADAERDRLTALLAESCARVDPGRPPLEVARELVRDHPDADGVIAAARHWTELAIAFTRDRDLVPYQDGECRVGLAPESRRWAMAMMSPAAPGEPDGAVLVPHHAAGRVLAGAGGRGVAARCSARPRCPASPCTRSRPGTSRTAGPSAGRPTAGPPHPALRGLRRGLGALRRGTLRRGGVLRRRSPVRDRRLAGGAGPGHPAGLRDRRAHGRDDGRGGRPPVRGGHPPVRPGGAVRGPPGHVRPDLRPLHLGQAGDHGPARAGQEGVGRGLLAAAGSTPRCWTSAPRRSACSAPPWTAADRRDAQPDRSPGTTRPVS